MLIWTARISHKTKAALAVILAGVLLIVYRKSRKKQER